LKAKKIILIFFICIGNIFAQNSDKDLSLVSAVQFWQRIFEGTSEGIRAVIVGGADTSNIDKDSSLFRETQFWQRIFEKTPEALRIILVGTITADSSLYASITRYVIDQNGDTVAQGFSGLLGATKIITPYLIADTITANGSSVNFDKNIYLLGENDLQIGSDSSTGRLTIGHSTSDDFLNFYNSGFNVFMINSDGEVGIGTENPEYTVDIRWKDALQIGSGKNESQSILKGNAGTNQDLELFFIPNFFGGKAWEWFAESEVTAYNYDFERAGSMNIIAGSFNYPVQLGLYHGSNIAALSNRWIFEAKDTSDRCKMILSNYNGASLPGGAWTRRMLTLDACNNKIGINDTLPNSTLDVNGSIEAKYTISGTNYNALNDDYTIELTNSGDTLFLPAGSGNKEYTIINASAGNIIIAADGSETLGNVSPTATLTLATGEAKGLVWNGTVWRVK